MNIVINLHRLIANATSSEINAFNQLAELPSNCVYFDSEVNEEYGIWDAVYNLTIMQGVSVLTQEGHTGNTSTHIKSYFNIGGVFKCDSDSPKHKIYQLKGKLPETIEFEFLDDLDGLNEDELETLANVSETLNNYTV